MLTHNPTPLAERFRHFAAVECASSPLYQHLAAGIAESPFLLGLAAEISASQPVANILLGAVHDLLLQGSDHPLSQYYPSIQPHPRPAAAAFPHFLTFCQQHYDDLLPIVRQRRVQTNVIERCALLLPGLALVQQLAGGQGLALIEIGCSAGLNLLWPHLAYHYQPGPQLGPKDAAVRLTCAVQAGALPLHALPHATWQIGVEIAPLDINNPADRRWLLALVWPEHQARRERLQQALQLAQTYPPPVVAGDALAHLPNLLPTAQDHGCAVVVHTFVVNQFSATEHETFETQLLTASETQPVYRLGMEWQRGLPHPQLGLIVYDAGRRTEQVLAEVQPHGEWLRWLHD